MISKYENLLGRSGNDLWDFMFQRDKDGKKTGRWVEELSAEFWSDRYELQKELENFEGNDLEERAKIIKKYFYKEDDLCLPHADQYRTQYKRLQD